MIAARPALIQFYPRALVALSHQIRALGDKVRLPLSPQSSSTSVENSSSPCPFINCKEYKDCSRKRRNLYLIRGKFSPPASRLSISG